MTAMLGNGDGTFQTKKDFPAGSAPQSIAAGDFNLDGRPDLVVANDFSGSTVALLLGNGDGTFQSPTTYATGPFPCSIAVGDLNLDGKPNLAVANCDGTVSVLRNIQGPDFSVTTSAANPASINPGQSASATVTIKSIAGWSGTVNLTCAVSATVTAAPICTVPASVNVTQGTAATVTAKISTSAAGTAGSISPANLPPEMMPISWTIVLLASGLLFAGYQRRMPALTNPMIAVVLFGLIGCGGGSSTRPMTTPGSPAGTYTATVAAKSGGLSHSTALTVIVQ